MKKKIFLVLQFLLLSVILTAGNAELKIALKNLM